MRWMHLSDIHFGYENASVDTMRKKLLEKARSFEHIDCLFITGDLRYGKNAPFEYPQETLDFLLELRSALGLMISTLFQATMILNAAVPLHPSLTVFRNNTPHPTGTSTVTL